MRQMFRVADSSVHIGLPIRIACLILNILSCPLYIFVLYFLPEGAAIPLMIIDLVIGVAGLIASLGRLRVFSMFYIGGQIVMTIPVWVSNAYIIYTLINFNGWYVECYDDMNNYWYECDDFSSYQQWLFDRANSFVWVGFSAAIAGTCIMIASIIGFRKLRIYQAEEEALASNRATQNPVGPSWIDGNQQYGHSRVVQQPVYVIAQPQQATTMFQRTVYNQPTQVQPPRVVERPPVYETRNYDPPPAYPQPYPQSSVDEQLPIVRL